MLSVYDVKKMRACDLSRPAQEGDSMNIKSDFARDGIAGAVVSLVAISFYLSSAALIFQGPLAQYLSLGIGAALLGGALLALTAAWRGSIGLASVGAEPATVPILAGMSVSIAQMTSGAALLPTLLAALAIAAVCIGMTWYAMGHYGVGNVIRFIPYPVIGGFLAGIGWLMFSGGIGVVAGQPFGVALLKTLADGGEASLQMLVGLGMGVVLWLATQKSKHVILLPALIVFFSLLVHMALWGNGVSLEQARAHGWLMNPFPLALPGVPFAPSHLSLIDWGAVASQGGAILSAMIVSIIALLLSDSSLEVAFDERADFNRDLKTLGLGNVVLGVAGGLAGGISISRSLLNKESGAATRWSGVVKALICVLAMFVGGPVIALIPKAVLGGILIYIGLGMLKSWVVDSRVRLNTSDYLAVLTMLCLTVAVGYLPAVVVGIVVCCFDFAVSSARLATVRRSFSRNDWPDQVERSASESALLHARGQGVRIVELQGALFFGSIRTLAFDIEKLLTEQTLERLVIDFRRVPWIDSSGAQAMSRLIRLAAKHRVKLSFCGVLPQVHTILKTNGCFTPQGPELAPDIDHALLDWDDAVIREASHSATPLEDWLRNELGSAELVRRLRSQLQEIHLQAGDALFHQGDAAQTLYLVQHGRLSAYLQVQSSRLKVRSIQAGGTVGEMGLYRDADRSATVLVDEPTLVLALTRETMTAIEREDAELALGLHKLFVRLLASRLDYANAQARALAL